MELFVILILGFILWGFFKIFGLIFQAGLAILSIPFLIIGTLVGVLAIVLFVIPVSLFAGLAGLLVAPFALLGPLLPVLLIVGGLYWLSNR